MLGKVAGTSLKFLGGAALAGVGLAGGMVGAAARDSIKLGETAQRFAINAKLAGQNVNAEDAKRTFESVAVANPGQTAQGIGEAALGFQSRTGVALNAEQLGVLATTAGATGAEVQDLAAAFASLHDKFGVKDINSMREAMATLTVQGAKGAFEIKDAASLMERMASAAQRFGLDKGARGVAVLGGLSQIARTATGSSEQASTAVEATLRQLVAQSGKLKASGVNVFDKTGKARDLPTVLAEAVSKVGGKDIEKKKVGLQQIFGEEGIRAISPLITAFADATLAGKDGMTAVNQVLHDAIDVGGNWNQVQEAASSQQKSASAQLTVAWESIKAQVGEKVVPALLEMVPAIQKVASSGIVDGMLDAFQAVAEGAAVAADFLKELGILKPKQKDKFRQLQDAEKEQKRFEATITNPMSMTREQIAERKRLRANVSTAEEALHPSAAPGETSNASKVFASFASPEDFASKFAAAEAPRVGILPGSVQYEALLRQGRGVASDIAANPSATKGDVGGSAAQQLEQQYAQQLIQQKAAEAATKAETKAKEDAAKAAQELAMAMRNVRDEASRSVPLNQR